MNKSFSAIFVHFVDRSCLPVHQMIRPADIAVSGLDSENIPQRPRIALLTLF